MDKLYKKSSNLLSLIYFTFFFLIILIQDNHIYVMILYKLLPLEINDASHVFMCPLVHNYSVITPANWHLAYCDPTRSNDHKMVDCTAISINRTVAQSPFVFLF